MPIAAALLLAAAAAFACGGGPDSNESAGDGGAPGAAPAASVDAVKAFDDYAAELQPSARMEPSTIAEGLRALAGALGTLGVAPPEILVDLRVVPEHVLLNPASPDVAATVRQALVAAAGALVMAPGANGAAVQQAAERIQADMPLTGQGAALRTFFQESAKATRAAAQKSP